MVVIQVRSIWQLVMGLVGTLIPVLIISSNPIPMTHIPGSYAVIPCGPLLVAAPLAALGWLWRDVAAPVSTVSVRLFAERLRLWTASLVWAALSAVAVALRVYPALPLKTTVATACFFAGVAMIVSSRAGAVAGSTVVVLLAICGFLLAPLGSIAQWPYRPSHTGATLPIGLLVLILGSVLALTSGFDHGRLRRDRLVGVNDA